MSAFLQPVDAPVALLTPLFLMMVHRGVRRERSAAFSRNQKTIHHEGHEEHEGVLVNVFITLRGLRYLLSHDQEISVLLTFVIQLIH